MRLIRLLKNDIAKEAAEWVDDNIIDQSQAEKICARYDVDYHQAQSYSFAYNVLMGLGYLFIGLSLITLLGANWDDIPRALRMWGLIGLTLVTHGFAIKKLMAGEPSAAIGIFLLANLFFGASIILIAQIYHLGEHMPDGVFWWALGCLPIALILKNPWLMLQSTLLGLIWFLLEVNMGFYPILFPIFILASLYVLIYGKESILLFVTLIASIVLWYEYSLAEYWRMSRHFDFHAEHLVSSVALFILAYSLSHWLSKKNQIKAKDYAAILAIWSLRFGLILMLVLSFEEPWRELISANWEHQDSMFKLIGGLLLISFIFAYTSKKLSPTLYIIPFYLISLLAILLSGNKEHAVYFQILYNLMLISVGVWLIIRGIHQGISHYFFLGVTAILVTALMRYIDLIGDYIGGAVLFMVFAIFLLGAAKYWKNYQEKVNE